MADLGNTQLIKGGAHRFGSQMVIYTLPNTGKGEGEGEGERERPRG